MLLAEVPELELLSTTMENGLVGDQSRPTVDDNAGSGLHDSVDQTSFVREVMLGLSPRQEMQKIKVEGCWGGQTARQSVQIVMSGCQRMVRTARPVLMFWTKGQQGHVVGKTSTPLEHRQFVCE